MRDRPLAIRWAIDWLSFSKGYDFLHPASMQSQKQTDCEAFAQNPTERKHCAAAYCRVKDDFDHIATEFKKDYYRGMINNNPQWQLSECYVDVGSFDHQEAFNRMMKDAEAGQFEVLITPLISRFAQNAYDCIIYARRLQKLGIPILFEAERVSTEDGIDDLVLAIAKQNEMEASLRKKEVMPNA